jgi:hypothetical protein
MPEVAKDASERGIEAFIRYYFEVRNYSVRTGEVEPLKSLADEACEGCQGDIEQTVENTSDGRHIVGGEYHITNLEIFNTKSYQGANVDFRVDASQVFHKNGKPAGEKVPEHDVKVVMQVGRATDHWIMTVISGRQGS